VAALPGATGLGDCGELIVIVFRLESVNVVDACDFEPTAVRANPMFMSSGSVVKLLSEIFPFASATAPYGPCVSINGDSTSVKATVSPGTQPEPVM
jgi:hypothetical protein